MDNELKVFGKTILTTTEHLKNLETVNATVYNKNGQFNLQGLSINTSQSVSNFTKLNNAFKAYNSNLTKSTQLQSAYIKAVGNQNGALGNYLAGLNGAKASMGGYIKSLIEAKAATIGLQVASTLLNAALSFGLSLALSAIVSGITHLINKEKEAREQAIENAQTAKEEADNLTELLNKYNQLSEEVKTNTGAKDDLLETQWELLESLGIEQSQLDGLIKKYGDLNTAINKVALDSLKDAQADLMVAVDAREKELINVGKDRKHWFSLTNRNLISTGGEESKQAYDVLAKAGVISQDSVGTGGGVFALVGDDKTVDGILENYQKLKEAQTALDEAVSNGEISKEDMGSNPLYKAINSRLDELKTAVDNYNSAIKDVNENSANQEIISNLIGKDLPQTEEEFETFKQSLIDSAQASNNFIGSQEDIKNSIIDALAEMPEFEKYFENLAQAESDVQHETPISFTDAFNSSEYKDVKEKLLDLAKSGEITSKTLSSTQEYNTLLEKVGISAESAKDQILDMLSVQERLAGTTQGLDKLKSAYEEFKNKDIGFVTAETLESLPDVFKNLPEFDSFSKIAGNPESGKEKIQQAFNDIVKAYILDQETLQGLVGADSNTVQTYIANLKQMGVTNAEEVVRTASEALNSDNKMINDAEKEYNAHYEEDYNSYTGYIGAATVISDHGVGILCDNRSDGLILKEWDYKKQEVVGYWVKLSPGRFIMSGNNKITIVSPGSVVTTDGLEENGTYITNTSISTDGTLTVKGESTFNALVTNKVAKDNYAYYVADNTTRKVYLGVSEGNNAGIYDATNSQWIIKSDTSKNVTLMGKTVNIEVSETPKPTAFKPYLCKSNQQGFEIATAGYVTGNSTNICFFVPCSRYVVGNPTPSAYSVNGFIIRQSGKYTHGSSSTAYVKPSSYSVSLTPGGFNIVAVMSSTTNAINNAPCGIRWSGVVALN